MGCVVEYADSITDHGRDFADEGEAKKNREKCWENTRKAMMDGKRVFPEISIKSTPLLGFAFSP